MSASSSKLSVDDKMRLRTSQLAASNQQITLANATFALQQAQANANAAQQATADLLKELSKKAGCEIDPGTIECKFKK